ncbi:cilia- and flagella-associated protein 299 isoform X2 [Takifugu flavidus]|uniref:cilia- and flagella-associated protein 299 isoform X2 n=1 Tax=Takifugu flavidus TaxID=433684 RepID=UPI002544CA78|nr:cilia- and flagella-associated protein 299 isoform X2 [Takifugu flavidus]
MENTSAPYSITQFKQYEDYLDSKMTQMDLAHLTSRKLAQSLVELGLKGPVLSKEEFEEKKAAALAAEAENKNSGSDRNQPVTLASAGKEIKDSFLRALAEREEANRSGKMTSIIFIRDHNTAGQEVSGYIDYAHRLKTCDFNQIFSGKKKLMPGHSDLCFYNWETHVSSSNPSPNFEVIYKACHGLLFMSRNSGKILDVDPWTRVCSCGAVTERPRKSGTRHSNHKQKCRCTHGK